MAKPLNPKAREGMYQDFFGPRPGITAKNPYGYEPQIAAPVQIDPEQQRRNNTLLFASRGGIKSRKPAQDQEVQARNLPSQFGTI